MEKEEFRVYKDTRIYRNDGKLCKGALWEVSNLGNMRKNGEEFLPYEDNDKYLHFGYNYVLHRAVAELFVPNPDNKPTVDHINRDIHDNRACNLRWATMKEQMANRDNDAISKSLIGNKHALGNNPSEEARAKMGAATLGTIWVINPTTDHSARINPLQLTDYITKGYIRGRKTKK